MFNLITIVFLARHIVLSPSQAISCIHRWRTERTHKRIGLMLTPKRWFRFMMTTRFQYCSMMTSSMAIIILKPENGLKIKNHLSSFDLCDEVSKSECARLMQTWGSSAEISRTS